MKKTEFACVIYTIFFLTACTQKNAAEVKFNELSQSSVSQAHPIISEKGGFRIYEVLANENILDVAQNFNVEIAVIIELNQMAPPYRLKKGQLIKLPGEDIKREEIVEFSIPETSRETISPIELENKKISSSGSFAWPYKGKIISSFGRKKGGVFNNGINIRTRKGKSVVAADGGEVIYSGKDVKGYGSLVIIKHEKGWITTYSLARAKVEQGQMVKKGEEIGIAGAEIHFAMRKDKTLVNPKDYLH